MREFLPGEVVRIRTTIAHQALIARVYYTFHNQGSPRHALGITYEVPEDERASGKTEVELRYKVPPTQEPGVYMLDRILVTTVGDKEIQAEVEEDLPNYAGFRIKPEPKMAYAGGWEVEP